MFVDGPMDLDKWHAFEHELRDAFDEQDGVHFEIVLMRLQTMLEHLPDNGDDA